VNRSACRQERESGARLGVVILLGVLCMAPTAGDVGGCGTDVIALDPDAFAIARKDVDCTRCKECGLSAPRCQRACDLVIPPDTNLPRTCKPIQHDGDVCLRALRAASCQAYATYVDELAPATPSECEFCQIAPPPGTRPTFTFDAGVVDGGPP
jgi:hypothetical protein